MGKRARQRAREGRQPTGAMIRCLPSGRLMTRARYDAIARRVATERRNYWRHVEARTFEPARQGVDVAAIIYDEARIALDRKELDDC